MHDDDLEMDVEMVTIKDEAGRTIACTIEHSVEVEGDEYVLLLPIDSPVEIFAWQENGSDEEAIPVDDEDDIDRLFSIAKAVLEEQNLTLKRTAVTLTVEGELPEYEDDDELLEGENSDDQEELQFLASFYHEEQEFGIYAPLDPFFILARMNEDDQPQLLTQAELEKLEPILPMIEDQLLDQFE